MCYVYRKLPAAQPDSALCLFAGSLAQLERQLGNEVANFVNSAYAPNTKKAYSTHRRSYLSFCEVMGYSPVPANTQTLSQYAAVLARTLKYSSVKQYLNVVRLLHLEWNLPNPLANNFHLQCVLRGIRRKLGDTPCRKAPMTLELLRKILPFLNMSRLDDVAVWAAMLLMFYGMMRVASALCGAQRCDHSNHLTLSDLRFHKAGVDVTVRTTKTIQFKERALVIPLPRVPGSILCPTQALFLYTQTAPTLSGHSVPLFVTSQAGRPLTYTVFTSRVKQLVMRAGGETGCYGGHSFRRGGACLAYRLGVPVDVIRQIGDWASNAYTAYIVPDRPLISRALNAMASHHN